MSDWISHSEPVFLTQLEKWDTYLNANTALLGVSPAALASYTALKNVYDQKLEERDTYVQDGAPIFQALKDADEALVAEMRLLGREIQARRETTDEQRAGLGLTIPDTTGTGAVAPASAPVIIKIDSTHRLTHIVHWRDELTPDKKARPAGAKRAILFQKVGGAAPVGPDDMEEVAADNATPYLCEFEAAQAGQPCHWAICWEGTTGLRGPLSPVMTWTIPA